MSPRTALPLPLFLIFAACRGGAGHPASPPPSPGSSALAAAVTPKPDPALKFEERGRAAGLTLQSVAGSREKRYILEANGSGACAFDFDGDGFEDLYIVNGQTLDGSEKGRSALYHNRGDGSFEDVTEGSGTANDGWGFGCAVADYDQDGRPDLYVAAWGPDHLYHNLGAGRFEEVTKPAGIADDAWGESASFGDYDRDGLPDLYVANYLDFSPARREEPRMGSGYLGLKGIFYGPIGLPAEPDLLYHNRGDGTFEDVSARSGIRKPKPKYGLATAFVDLDGDGWPDILVANDSVGNFAFLNQRDGTFAEKGVELGLAYNADGKPQASMGIAWGDVDGDGRDDLLVTNFSDDKNTLYRNDGAGFVDASYEAGLGAPSWTKLAWGTAFLDADNDGSLDLFVADGHVFPQIKTGSSNIEYEQEDQLYRGDGRGHFTLVEGGDLGRTKHLSRGAAVADFDRDGRLDIVVVRLHETPALYHNVSKSGSWIAPRLEGRDCNRDALGAVVTASAGGRSVRRTVFSGGSYASQSQLRLHFGLGAAAGKVELRVRWPCGRDEQFVAEIASYPTLVEGAGSPHR